MEIEQTISPNRSAVAAAGLAVDALHRLEHAEIERHRAVEDNLAEAIIDAGKGELLPVVYIYNGCRWATEPPARHRYLMEALSAHTHVIFLDTPVYTGNFFEFYNPRAERLGPSLTLIHNAVGFRATRLGKRLGRPAAMLDGWWLKRALRQVGVKDYVYWIANPDPALLVGMRQDRVVYDCIDPCFMESVRKPFDEAEFAMARAASMVFCSAHSLLERLQPINPNCHLLPNACSFDEYDPTARAALEIPAPLRGRKPIIGFLGTFDWRFDLESVLAAAKALPQFTFALAGRINKDQEQRVRPLQALPNVIMPGPISLAEGRAWTAAFDVGLIPFVPGEVGDGVNPVKMYMYLAAGKPVVSTWIRECRGLAPLVLAARGPEEFVAAIHMAAESAQTGGEQAAQRIDFAKRNTWRERAAAAAEYLRAGGFTFASSSRAGQVSGRLGHGR